MAGFPTLLVDLSGLEWRIMTASALKGRDGVRIALRLAHVGRAFHNTHGLRTLNHFVLQQIITSRGGRQMSAFRSLAALLK